MRDNALYFPYISVPDDKWTIKTLLYWDKLSSIVPMDHINNPDQLSPFMQKLVQEELVEQVFPAHHLYQIEDFESCFINLIKRRLNNLRKLPNKLSRVHREKLNGRSLIHAEKMGQIPDFLINVGLAKRTDNWSWYEVDTRVANLFMAYLASCLGALDEVNASPVTNSTRYSMMFGGGNRPTQKANFKQHQEARHVILKSLLPVPNQKVTLDQLVRFKSDHGHLLPPLRRKIEAHCASIAVLPNKEDRIITTEQFIADCTDAVDEIMDAMKPTWQRITLGSITPLFGAGFTLHATNTGNKLAYAGAAFTFAATAYQAISSIRGNRENLLNRPLAYVAHARSGLYA